VCTRFGFGVATPIRSRDPEPPPILLPAFEMVGPAPRYPSTDIRALFATGWKKLTYPLLNVALRAQPSPCRPYRIHTLRRRRISGD